jgi:hypothetical protein
MATADRAAKRSKRNYDEQPRRKSHVLRNSFLLLVLLGGVAAYFAPVMIANTSLRNWMLQTAIAPEGTVTAGSASLGWFSPVVADNLEVRDREGKLVLSIGSFRTEKTLVALVLDVDQIGRVHVDKPDVHVVAYEHDTNLERVFAALLNSDEESNVTAQVAVTDGTLLYEDTVAKREYKISELEADGTLGDAAEGLALAASGKLAGQQQPGSFQVDLRATPSKSTGAALANGKLHCQTTALPLELLDPLLRRSVDSARLSGQMSSELDGAWGDLATEGEASLKGVVRLADVNFAATALSADTIHLDHVEMPCRIRQQGDMVEVDELSIQCELGQLSLTGSAKTSDFSTENIAAALVREKCQLKGRLDLAKLAAMLPETLMLREGTQITAGQVEILASAHPQQSGTSWTGLVETKQLTGMANGRPIAWDQPLAVQFAVHDSTNGITIDRAVCTSRFLQVSAAGSLDNMTATAEFDLSRLLTELQQFSDLNRIHVAGQGRAKLTVKRTGESGVAVDADFQARGFQWITENGQPWKEDSLTAKLTAAGQLSGQSIKRIDSATLTVDAGADHLDVQLRDALAELSHGPWPLDCTWRGQLAAWPARLAAFGVTGWNLAGSGSLQALVDASPSIVTLKSGQAQFNPLQVQGGRVFVNEPAVTSTFAGKYDVEQGRLDISSATLVAGTATVALSQAILHATETGLNVNGGKGHVEGDLAQFARWVQDPKVPAAWQVSGKLVGDAELKHADGTTSGQINAAVDGLRIVDALHPAKPGAAPASWQEPRITLASRVKFEHPNERLLLDGLEITSNALRVVASGDIAMSSAGGNVDLQGTTAYDWAQLEPLWRPYLGKGFQISGRDAREFAIRGRLTGAPTSPDSWKNVTGKAGIGWTEMNLYGLLAGEGEIEAQLGDGQVRTTKPIDFTISEGRLTAAPVVRLSPAPAELTMPAGTVLTNVRLSPELCSAGMRFVAPLLANATVAEGRFSVALDGARIPVADPAAGQFSGRMAIDGQIRPGPVAQEFVGLIKEIVTLVQSGRVPNLRALDGALMSVDNSNVEFELVNRRIYHRNLTIIIGTTPITTKGSVGFDESLKLLAEVPINARLLGADLSLGAFEGQKLQIPISGTLSKPKLDRSALRDIPRQLLENTARDVLTNGLNRGLEQLFQGQK